MTAFARFEVLELAHSLKVQRHAEAVQLLLAIGCADLARKIKIEPPPLYFLQLNFSTRADGRSSPLRLYVGPMLLPVTQIDNSLNSGFKDWVFLENYRKL